ncbi:hypothetical protein V2647_07620 [Tenacibaculum maritimum]|uniref:hypothetical protein n=1 Tax=Tenacibaculum maritimum TaxID=107401 RepID=UPI00387709AE
MKKTIILIAVLFFTKMANSQRIIEFLTFENTQDINFFRKVKNRTLVLKYQTENKNTIKVGDTVILGKPTSQEVNTRTYSASYGKDLVGGVADSKSTAKKTYEFIKMGRPAGFGSIMNALAGEEDEKADNSLKNTKVIIEEIKAYHRGSKKKPLYLVLVLGEINGRAFGVNKYLSVMDAELAIESKEILLKNSKMTRKEAISKLKEAKELLDLEMISKEEYEILKKKVAPIIREKE